jgi:N-acetylneuraminic acid mutarotase
MRRLGCTPTSAPLRPTRRGGLCPLLVAALGTVALVTALDCRQDAESPSLPEDSPATGPSSASLTAGDLALAATTDTWLTRANMPTPRSFLATAVVPNASGKSVLYAIGGVAGSSTLLGKVQAYDVATNTWSVRASLPKVLNTTNGAVEIGGKIYLSGGESAHKTANRHLYVYDPGTDIWSQKRDMPIESYEGVSGAIDGKLYVLTSCRDEDRCVLAGTTMLAFYRYDPATDQWTSLPTPPLNHNLGAAGVIGGKLYVAGGFTVSAGVALNRNPALDVYDPATNAWTPRASMPRGRSSVMGVAVGGKLYVIGGVLDGGTVTAATTVYDPATDRWTSRARMPLVKISESGARVFVNGKPRIEIVGGDRPNNLQYVP